METRILEPRQRPAGAGGLVLFFFGVDDWSMFSVSAPVSFEAHNMPRCKGR